MSIEVKQAIYASNWKGFDVTPIVQEISKNAEFFTVSNEIFGDPSENEPKFFGAIFMWESQLWSVACSEGQQIGLLPDDFKSFVPLNQLAPGADKPSVSFGMYSCAYGGNDVSAICQAIINVGARHIHVNNHVMGVDPMENFPKYLIAQIGNGFYGGREGDIINLG